MYKKDIRDASGFIKDTTMWSTDFAKNVADEYPLELTDKHYYLPMLICEIQWILIGDILSKVIRPHCCIFYKTTCISNIFFIHV